MHYYLIGGGGNESNFKDYEPEPEHKLKVVKQILSKLQPIDYKILCYNIQWETVCTTSTRQIVSECVMRGRNGISSICLDRVKYNVYKAINTSNIIDCDIIGFFEGSCIEELIDELTTFGYAHIKHIAKTEFAHFLYLESRFDLIKWFGGDIAPLSETTNGRAVIVVKLYDKILKKFVLFIPTHNGHSGMDPLEKTVTQILKDNFLDDINSNIDIYLFGDLNYNPSHLTLLNKSFNLIKKPLSYTHDNGLTIDHIININKEPYLYDISTYLQTSSDHYPLIGIFENNYKRVAYDFDGVIHTDVTDPDIGSGQRHPINSDSTNNKLFQKICKIIMLNTIENGNNQYIITARRDTSKNRNIIEQHLKEIYKLDPRIQTSLPFANIVFSKISKSIDIEFHKINDFYDDSCNIINEIKSNFDKLFNLNKLYLTIPENENIIRITKHSDTCSTLYDKYKQSISPNFIDEDNDYIGFPPSGLPPSGHQLLSSENKFLINSDFDSSYSDYKVLSLSISEQDKILNIIEMISSINISAYSDIDIINFPKIDDNLEDLLKYLKYNDYNFNKANNIIFKADRFIIIKEEYINEFSFVYLTDNINYSTIAQLLIISINNIHNKDIEKIISEILEILRLNKTLIIINIIIVGNFGYQILNNIRLELLNKQSLKIPSIDNIDLKNNILTNFNPPYKYGIPKYNQLINQPLISVIKQLNNDSASTIIGYNQDCLTIYIMNKIKFYYDFNKDKRVDIEKLYDMISDKTYADHIEYKQTLLDNHSLNKQYIFIFNERKVETSTEALASPELLPLLPCNKYFNDCIHINGPITNIYEKLRESNIKIYYDDNIEILKIIIENWKKDKKPFLKIVYLVLKDQNIVKSITKEDDIMAILTNYKLE